MWNIGKIIVGVIVIFGMLILLIPIIGILIGLIFK
jgi:hypothetical protein